MEIPGEKETENTWNNNDSEHPQINVGHQTTGTESSEYSKQNRWGLLLPQNDLGISF